MLEGLPSMMAVATVVQPAQVTCSSDLTTVLHPRESSVLTLIVEIPAYRTVLS